MKISRLNHQGLYWVGLLLTVGMAIATVLGFFGALSWQLALLDHLRPHYILGLGLATILLWCYGSGQSTTKVVLLVGLVTVSINATLLLPIMVPRPFPHSFHISFPHSTFRTEVSRSDSLSIMLLNLARNNRQRDRVIDYLNQQDAEILLLQELTPEWLTRIEQDLTHYDIVKALPQTNSQGSAILQRRSLGQESSDQSSSAPKLLSTRVNAFPERSTRPILSAEINWQGQSMSLLSLHVTRPMSASNARYQQVELAAITQWVQATETPSHPVIVMGDFNNTPWSQVFRTFQRQSELSLAQHGWGLKSTWPTSLPPVLQIPIDCCLHSPSLKTIHYQVGPNLGSDHRPIAVRLSP